MVVYILRRLFYGFLTLLGISFVVFLLLFLTGDPVHLMLPPDATVEQVEAARIRLGFDKPFFVQYFEFLKRLSRLDFGVSLRRRVPVLDLIGEYFFNTTFLKPG